MEALLTLIANFIYQYGVTCAGAPSFHGSYEAPVPSQLRKSLKRDGSLGGRYFMSSQR